MISEREFLEGVALRLKALRMALDKTQEDIGEKIGVGKTAISNYEKADRLISPFDAVKLKSAYGAPLEWLYAGDESVLSPHLAAKLKKAEERKKAHNQRRRRKPAA